MVSAIAGVMITGAAAAFAYVYFSHGGKLTLKLKLDMCCVVVIPREINSSKIGVPLKEKKLLFNERQQFLPHEALLYYRRGSLLANFHLLLMYSSHFIPHAASRSHPIDPMSSTS